MLFQKMPPTPYDLRFRLFGIPTTIHPMFWLFAAVVTFSETEIGFLHWIVGILCVATVLLVHELGHAFAFQGFRAFPEIELQFMAGMATPDIRINERWKRVVCIAAGPGMGLLFAAVIFAGDTIEPWHRIDPLAATAFAYLFIGSLYINLFNLLPIYPLDGGQLMLEGWSHRDPRRGMIKTLECSVALAALYAGYCILRMIFPLTPRISLYFFDLPSGPFIGFFFGYIAWLDQQMLKRLRGW